MLCPRSGSQAASYTHLITEIVAFAGTSGVVIGSSWLLLDGVLTVIMSLFLLFNQWFTLLSLPFLFTVWLMFSGLSRFVSAFDLHAPGVTSGLEDAPKQ